MKVNFFNFKRKHWVIVSIFTFSIAAMVFWFANFTEKQAQKMRTIIQGYMIPEPFKVTEQEVATNQSRQLQGKSSDGALSVRVERKQEKDSCSSCTERKKETSLPGPDALSAKEESVSHALDQAAEKRRPFSSIAGLDNKFVRDIFQQISKEAGWRNVNVSPLGLSSMLAMAYEGAKGQTAQEIASALGFPLEKDDLKAQAHREFSSLIPSLNNGDQVSCVNSSWLGKDFVVLPEYKEVLNMVYRSDVYNVDFCNSSVATGKINAWCAQKTNGRIKDVMAKTTCSLRLVLINAIYFKAKWQIPFPKEQTYRKIFFVDDNLSADADMMTIQDKYFYAETPSFQILEMPYEKDRYSMIAFLPKARNSRSLFARMDADPALWEEAIQGLSALRHQEVVVHFPKFEFYNDWENIVDQLKALGVRQPFGDEANFSGISKEALYISKILQKTFIKVDEESTEAAAVTIGMMESLALPEKPEFPKEFIADHPFMYVIKDNQLKSILFIGQVVDPTKKK